MLKGGRATVNGELTRDDAKDTVRKDAHCKVYVVEFKAGKTYTIDHKSKEFDAFLRLEDADGKQLDENDDFDGLDSRIVHKAAKAGPYRIIATSLGADRTGAF